jgi:hypothetical protein
MSPTWRAKYPYLHPPGTGWPSYNSGHWVPFTSLLAILEATVEVFWPSPNLEGQIPVCIYFRNRMVQSKFNIKSQSHVTVRVTLRLTVSQYSYVLVSSPLRGRLTRYCSLFKSFGLEFVVPSVERPLWREAGSVLCKLESSHLSVCTFTINIFMFHTFIIYIYIYVYICIHYIIYTRPLLAPARYNRLNSGRLIKSIYPVIRNTNSLLCFICNIPLWRKHLLKVVIFWNIAACSPNMNHHFQRAYFSCSSSTNELQNKSRRCCIYLCVCECIFFFNFFYLLFPLCYLSLIRIHTLILLLSPLDILV